MYVFIRAGACVVSNALSLTTVSFLLQEFNASEHIQNYGLHYIYIIYVCWYICQWIRVRAFVCVRVLESLVSYMLIMLDGCRQHPHSKYFMNIFSYIESVMCPCVCVYLCFLSSR